jgi:signal transduction histidine kinase
MSEAPPPVTATPWYRSLYWRLALGLIAFLALMLVSEAALFLWTTDRIAGSMPAKSPRRLAVLVASDIAAALAADPALNLQTYVRDQYGHVLQTFLVMMRDGRVASNHDDVPPEVLDAARQAVDPARVRRSRPLPTDGFEPRSGRTLNPLLPRRRGQFGRDGRQPDNAAGRLGPRNPEADSDSVTGPVPPTGPGDPFIADDFPPEPPDLDGASRDTPLASARRQLRDGEFAPVIIAGFPVGRVNVLPNGPAFSRVVREFGPSMGAVAGGVLGVGTALIALIVFGPARRRLRHVQEATERLGSGDLTARAPDRGGDEVAALARSFNRMADELASRASALEASDKARRQLLADVSHELMTPLTAMRGYIETLAMTELELDESTRERYLEIVTEETHRLERIIGDLLDLARLEGGGTAMRRDQVLISTLFERVAARHERELSSRGITLTQRVEPGAEQLTGDPDRLEQALQNLAANALRHTPDGGAMSLLAARRGELDGAQTIAISVRDSGPGIDPAHLPLIFDRFYKVDAARKASGGSGLGLSIVKAIVERHGGTITARNDVGAVFEIVLPL